MGNRDGLGTLSGMLLLASLLQVSAAPLPEVDFSRDVRPVLAEHCFECHGPDAAAREGGLRLDLEDDAVRDRGGYAVVDRAAPGESELLARVHGGDEFFDAMPPEGEPPLSEDEVRILERWVAAGAPWGEHWRSVHRSATRALMRLSAGTPPGLSTPSSNVSWSPRGWSRRRRPTGTRSSGG